MHLVYCARLCPEQSCEFILLPAEWKLLRRKFTPKNRSKKPPDLNQAVHWIAQLCGFLNRKEDGEPGLKTLWRGIGVLHHLLEGAQLASTP
jgi:Transposase Tn5 dimerisation domain